jgi:hypothetical protein
MLVLEMFRVTDVVPIAGCGVAGATSTADAVSYQSLLWGSRQI